MIKSKFCGSAKIGYFLKTYRSLILLTRIIRDSSRLYGDSCKENPLSQIMVDVLKLNLTFLILSPGLVKKICQIYCQRKLWPSAWQRKKKQLYNLRCCITIQLEISGLATKNRFVHCLQRVVH